MCGIWLLLHVVITGFVPTWWTIAAALSGLGFHVWADYTFAVRAAFRLMEFPLKNWSILKKRL
jgi:hypothetical protein